MTFAATPDTLFVLPTNSFSIRHPLELVDITDPESRINLKVQVKVALLLPSSLVGAKPRKKWGMERNFDVVVPLGEKVDIGVGVREEGLGLLVDHPVPEGSATQQEAEATSRVEAALEEVQNMAQERLKKLLRYVSKDEQISSRSTDFQNQAALGLNKVTSSSAPLSSIDDTDNALLPFTAFSLHSVAAETSHSPIVNDRIPTGTPVAYLQRLEVTLGWYRPKKKSLAASEERQSLNPDARDEPHSNAENDDHHRHGTSDNARDEDALIDDKGDLIDDGYDIIPDGDDDLIMDDDDILPDDDDILPDDDDILPDDGDVFPDEDAMVPGYERSRMERILSPDLDRPDALADRSSTSTLAERAEHIHSSKARTGIIPDWALVQIETGLQKLLRYHLIKRFPLIFDGALLPVRDLFVCDPVQADRQYANQLSVPRSLPSSISRFVLTSERYDTSLHNKLLSTLQQIWELHETEVMERVSSLIATQPGRQISTPPDSDESQDSQRRKRKRTAKVSHEDQVEAYATSLSDTVREQAQGKHGSPEGLIRWVLRDAAMAIGRAEWTRRRASSGRLGAGRIHVSTGRPSWYGTDKQLKIDGDDLEDQQVHDSQGSNQLGADGVDMNDLHITENPYDDLIDDDDAEGGAYATELDLASLIDDTEIFDVDKDFGMDGGFSNDEDDPTIDPELARHPANINQASGLTQAGPTLLMAQERLDRLLKQDLEDQDWLSDDESILPDDDAWDDGFNIGYDQIVEHSDGHRLDAASTNGPSSTSSASSPPHAGHTEAIFSARPSSPSQQPMTSPSKVDNGQLDVLHYAYDGLPKDDSEDKQAIARPSRRQDDGDDRRDPLADIIDDTDFPDSPVLSLPTTKDSQHQSTASSSSSPRSRTASFLQIINQPVYLSEGAGQAAGSASDEAQSYRLDDMAMLPSRFHSSLNASTTSSKTSASSNGTPPLTPDSADDDVIDDTTDDDLIDDSAEDDIIDDSAENDIIDDSDEYEQSFQSSASLGVLFPYRYPVADLHRDKQTGVEDDGFDWTPRADDYDVDAGDREPRSLGDFGSPESIF